MPIADNKMGPDEKNWLDRSLSVFTEVHAGEGLTALLLAANIFFLFTLYSFLKPIRSALILSESGAVAQSYAAAGQAALLLVLVPLYGAFASRVTRMRLITGVTLFFAANLLVFWALGIAGLRVGIAFYVWLGIFNLMVPAQLWAFANDIYTTERGRRLFPIVGLGASVGAWVGAVIASQVFRSVGPYRLMVLAAIGLVANLAITFWVNRRERAGRAPSGQTRPVDEQPLAKSGGFQLVFAQRYLLYIAMLFVVLNIVNTLGEFLLGSLVEREATSAAAASGVSNAVWIGTFMAGFQANVNLLGLIFQLFLVSRIFKYIGVRGALYIMPLIALVSYSSIAFFPIITIVRLAKTLENGTDYSIQNTTRQALFLPTSREVKYKAKQAIDSFFWRFGDMLQAVVVFIGSRLAFGIAQYALVNLALVIVWLGLVVAITREHKKLVPQDTPQEAAA
jgi:AAA family ATP:ADP antiporter